ncbi:MAG TPA: hypothetical protein ENJ44_04560 [Oceanospirillales bacterium]|nr:hypothetical protein [Oceanospirillales bacterium]
MTKFKYFMTIFMTLAIVLSVNARKPKIDELQLIQDKVNQFYKKGYADSAPVEMDFIEQKLKQAREAKQKRKKKIVALLVIEMNADLKLIKKRYEVNQLNSQLMKLQAQNLQSKKTLDELKGQL